MRVSVLFKFKRNNFAISNSVFVCVFLHFDSSNDDSSLDERNIRKGKKNSQHELIAGPCINER